MKKFRDLDIEDVYSADFDGCAVGLTNLAGDQPIKKPWRIITSSERMAAISCLQASACAASIFWRSSSIVCRSPTT